MDISPRIEAIYQRALQLRQHAQESPVQQNLIDNTLKELYYLLDELQASEEELWSQNQQLLSIRHSMEMERQHYYALFNQSPDGYLVTSPHGKIREANLAIATMLNVSQPFLAGKPLVIFIAEEARPSFYAQLDRLHHVPKIHAWNVRLDPRRQAPFDAIATVSNVYTPVNSGVSLLWSLRSIPLDSPVTNLPIAGQK